MDWAKSGHDLGYVTLPESIADVGPSLTPTHLG